MRRSGSIKIYNNSAKFFSRLLNDVVQYLNFYIFSLQSIYDIYPKEEEIQLIQDHLKKVPAGMVFANVV